MQVTKNITLDLLETGSPVIIKAKQNDRNTRYIAAHLYVDGLSYPVPSGTEIAFRYKKPDGTAGFYDALPDGSAAISAAGNVVTVELVEQALTVPGNVYCEINLYNAQAERLTTFSFTMQVEASVLTDAQIVSSDYFNILTDEIAKALQAVTDAQAQADAAEQSAKDAKLSAQQAAENAAIAIDIATGDPATFSGAPVQFDYIGKNRIESVTVHGFTIQEGSGAPEPNNIRPIKNAGQFNGKITITGQESWFQYTDPNTKLITYVCEGIAAGWNTENAITGYCSDYPVGNITNTAYGMRGPTSSNPTGTVIVRDDSVSTLQDFKAKMARIKPTLIYISALETGKFYTAVSVTQSQEYHCYILELQDRLHNGDTIKTNVLQNNVLKNVIESKKSTYVITGKESVSVYSNLGYNIFLIYTNSQWSSDKTSNAICSHYPVGFSESAYWIAGPSGANPVGTIRLRDDRFKNAEDLKADLTAKYEAKNPVTVEYELSAPEIHTYDPVKINNTAGAATISGETGTTIDVLLSPLVTERALRDSRKYSTEEIDTGETWVDGKDIYRKTYATGNLPASGAAYIDIDVDAIDAIVNYYGTATDDTNTITLPYYVLDEASGAGVQVGINNNRIKINVGGDRSSYSGFVTLEYTKK